MCFPHYPLYLTTLRSLCRFFRNESFRRHIVKALDPRHPELGLKTTLKYFTASFAKWRYETMPTVLYQLKQLRNLCEGHMRRELFGKVQDESLLKEVIAACGDKGLWQWISVANKLVYWPLEKLRRWGMVCGCHEKERSEGKKISCPHDSRRLGEVWEQILLVTRQFRDTANNLSLGDDCEGNAALHKWITDACRSLVDAIRARTRYLRSLPWNLCIADSQYGAGKCLEQFALRPREGHEELTVSFIDEHQADMMRLRDTGVLTDRLKEGVRILRKAPLDESAGEGYHRSTNMTKIRAPGATLGHIKAAVRNKQNLGQVKKFLGKHKQRGRAVFRYDWTNYKRLLQAHPWRRMAPVKMLTKAFYERVYRADEKALEDWSLLATAVEPVKQVRISGEEGGDCQPCDQARVL